MDSISYLSLPKIKPSTWQNFWSRPELIGFVALLVICNTPILLGPSFHSLAFQPEAVRHGEWWRIFTHPFAHLTWYHLLLDGSAFLSLYQSLQEPKFSARLAYVGAAAAGSLALSIAAAPAFAASGLCGLSGMAHGLMAITTLEMVARFPRGSAEHRIGWIGFTLVVAKAAFEAVTGRMFFAFLDFGLLGHPVAVSHAGGIIGGLAAYFLLTAMHRRRDKPF
jgi:rhomboid family GlyGly-CTERM serine protease